MQDRPQFMQRRTFIQTTGLLLGASFGPPAVQVRPRLRWRLASSFPRSADIIYGSAVTIARRVAALTDGYFQIHPYPAGEIVPPLQVLDAVQQGAVHLGHTGSYYYIGKEPAFAFDTGVPFGFTPRQQAAWKRYGGGNEVLNELFHQFDIVRLSAGNTGVQMGGWFRKPVTSLRDLQGIRMRIPGLGGEVLARMGVTVQVLSGSEVYPALERGVIDAAEWIGPYDDEKLGLYRVAPYYYYPGWWDPGSDLALYIRKDRWESLPLEYKEALQAAVVESGVSMLAAYDARNPQALQRLLERGIHLRPFSSEIMEAAYQHTFALYEELASASPLFRKVYVSWRAFRKQIFSWFDTAERAYAAFAFPRG